VRRVIFALISFFIYDLCFAQIITSSFVAPDTVCVNQTFTIQNTTTGSVISTTYWNFCSGNSVLSQTANLGLNPALSWPTFCAIANDNGNYYIFVTNNFPSSVTRYSFGNSLSNIPVVTNLGNFSNTLPPQMEGIRIEKEGATWYGIAVGGQGISGICRLNFGNSLANMPTLNNMGNIGGMSYPVRLQLIESGANRYGFTVNHDNNTITRFNFGNSLSNTPVGTNLGNIGGLTGPCDIAFACIAGNWYGWVIGDGNTIVRLNFGTSLLNTPTGTNLGNPGGITHGRSIFLEQDCNGLKGMIGNGTGNNILAINFPSGPTGPIVTTNLGNYSGFNFAHSIDKYRVGDTVFMFVPNTSSNSLSRIKYVNCSGTVPSSTLFTPPTMSYSATGIYTVVLLTNELNYNRSVACKTIAVVNTITLSATVNPTSNICAGNSATLTATGASSYTWSPGPSTLNPFVTNPVATTIYTVVGSLGACMGTKTIGVTVNPSPTLILSSSNSTICAGETVSLTSSGANTYTWNPGALTGSNVVVSPTVTTTYTASGDNGTCVGVKTIQIIVNPLPPVSAYANFTFVCLGESATLSAIGAQTYTWNPGNLNGSTIFPTPTVNTTYSVTGTNSLGCTNTAVVSVTVGANPSVSIVGPYKTACFGTTTGFVATGAISYTWFPNGPVNLSILSTVAVANTVYTVVGSVGSCTNMATATLVVNPLPTITAVASPSVRCFGGPASTITAMGGISYTWSPLNYLGGPPSGSTAVSTTPINYCYSITGSNSFGCYSTAIICLTVQPTPTVNILSLPGVMCIGDQGSLEASGATSYTWLPGASNNTNISVTPTTTSTYTLYGQTGACIGNSVITVTVNPTPTLSALVITPTLCVGKSTNMFASGASSFTWEPGSIFGFSTQVSPTVNTTYTITGNTLNCFSSQTVDVIILQNPILAILNSHTATCLDPLQSATLTASGANTFTWLPSSTASQSISASPSVAVMYTVNGTNSNGCISSTTVALNVNPDLQSEISDTSICFGSTVNLLASGALNYNWNPGNFSQATVNVIPEANTIYTITGTSGVCSKSRTVYVEVITNPIHSVPEVFTPNGDGLNDRFVILSDAQTKIDIKVFNRWGSLVYAHSEYDNNWDGTANGAMVVGKNKLPQGTYYYVMELESCDKQIIRGYVVIHY
jgi:gliding motility-associated-like protein